MLFIHNDVVAEILTMEDCIAAQERAFRDLAEGRAAHRPRSDIYAPCEREDGYYRWGTMEGYSGGYLAIRMKSDVMTWPKDADGNWTEDKYCVKPGTYCGLIMLFSVLNGEPLAFINDGVMQHMRVGGGGGIGAKHLARGNAATVGMLGSGGMARTYLRAYCAVRGIRKVKVYSPTRANREAYASEMSRRLNIEVQPVDSAREAIRGVDIVSSCTDSMAPTFEAGWLEPGQHVTMLGPMEISTEVIARADVRITQGRSGLTVTGDGIEHGVGHSPMAWVAGSARERERLPPKQENTSGFAVDFPDFGDLVTGRTEGRTSDEQITFYHNIGNQGLQFSSVGGLVYEKAKAARVGRQVPTEWFLQDIRD
jgi:alanine dehydrogenase